MKRIIFNTLIVAALVITGMTLTSCTSDPERPENEINNKHHEDPTSAVFTLIEGTLKEGKPFSADLTPNDVTLADSKQTIIYAVDATHNKKKQGFHIDPAKGATKFVVKNTEDNPNTVYLLKLDYYNVKHELMNDQFFLNQQDRIHQHFFQLYKKDSNGISIRETDKRKLPFDYVYADEFNNSFIGKTNPMGFKGFIVFKEKGRKFELKVALMHAGNASKFDNNHKASEFYTPSPSQIANSLWDFTAALPIEIQE